MDELEIEYYKNVDEKALQIRIDYNILEKNINMLSLYTKMGFVLVKYSSLKDTQIKLFTNDYDQKDGFTIKKKYLLCFL